MRHLAPGTASIPILLCMMVSHGGPALAEDATEVSPPSRSEGFDEILVRAQRHEEILQQTPIAVSVFDQSLLDMRSISDLQSLSFAVPNFHYGETLGQARITIRGISTAGGDQAAAFHIDGIYQNSSLIPNALTFFDLKQVEVLRGPQGTLAGRNATGGALFVDTQEPEFTFDAFGDVQVGNHGEIITRGVLNVPLVEDRVAARVSFIQDKHDGYLENLEYDRVSRDHDNKELYAVRGQLRVTPSDSVDWVLRTSYADSSPRGGLKIAGDLPAAVELTDQLPPQRIYANASPNPADEREVYLDTKEQTDTELVSFSSELTWDPPTLPIVEDTTFTLLAGWQERTQSTLADIDRSNAKAFGSGLELLAADVDVKQQEWVIEANWTSDNDDPIKWVLGLFYLGTDGSLETKGLGNLPFNVFGVRDIGVAPTRSRTDGEDTSVAAFFDVSYLFFDELEWTNGVRYTRDWKESTRNAQQVDLTFGGLIGNFLGGPVCVVSGIDSDRDKSWDAWTGRSVLKWQYTDTHMLYGSYSRGYKAGTIQHPVATSDCPIVIPFDNTEPETIDAVEIGSKNQFFNRRFQANLAAFFYDYDNIQIATLVESTVVTENAKGAEVAGVELEFMALPLEEVLLTANFSYLYSEFTNYKNGCLVEDASTCMPGGFLDFTGNELPRAPEWSATFTAQYRLTTTHAGTLTPHIQFFVSDELFFRASNLGKDKQNDYWLMDARLTWRSPSDRLTWELFVDNALDKTIVDSMVISSPLLGSPLLHGYGSPRTFGTRLSARW